MSEPRPSVSPEDYLALAKADDKYVPDAGVVPFVFDLLASSADVASIFERLVRKGGPASQAKTTRDRVVRDLGYVLRNVVLVADHFGYTLRDVIDQDAERLMPEEPSDGGD